MSSFGSVARLFSGSTQIAPARDVYPFPEPDIQEMKTTMVVQMVWFSVTLLSLFGAAAILNFNGDNLAFRILAAIGVAFAILPQFLVMYFRFNDGRKDSEETS